MESRAWTYFVHNHDERQLCLVQDTGQGDTKWKFNIHLELTESKLGIRQKRFVQNWIHWTSKGNSFPLHQSGCNFHPGHAYNHWTKYASPRWKLWDTKVILVTIFCASQIPVFNSFSIWPRYWVLRLWNEQWTQITQKIYKEKWPQHKSSPLHFTECVLSPFAQTNGRKCSMQ